MNSPSRRDDFISLAYMMLFLMNELPMKDTIEGMKPIEMFMHLKQ